MKVTYDATRLMKCAQFIWAHNPSALDWGPDSFVELGQRILNEAIEQAKQNAKILKENRRLRDFGHEIHNDWVDSVSTGGYTLYFTHEDDTIHVEFLVDPAIGLDSSQRNPVQVHI